MIDAPADNVLIDDPGARRAQWLDWLVIAGVGILAAVCLLFATRYGAGTSPDSISYLGMSKSYVAGRGMYREWGAAHFPPLYPFLLAGVTRGSVTVDGVRWVNALFLLGSVVAAAGVVRAQGGGRWAMLAAGAIVGFAAPLLSVYAMVWSEVPFLFFVMLAFWGLALYTRDGGWVGLVVAGAAVALATLTRFVGLALIGGGGLSVLAFSPVGRRWVRRIVDTAIFGVIAAGPVAAFMIWDRIRSGSATDRQKGYYPLTREDWEIVKEMLATWFKPSDAWTVWAAVGVALLAAVALWVWRRPVEKAGRVVRVPWFVLVMALAHVALVVLTAIYVDAQTPLDNRLFCAVYAALAVLVVCVGAKVWARAWDRAWLRWSVLVAGLFVVVPTVDAGVRWAVETRNVGIGYSSKRWMENRMMDYVREMSPKATLYSNVPDAVRLITGRDCTMIPPKTLAASNKPNPRFERDVAKMWADVRQNGAVLFFHGAPRSRKRHQASMRELAAGLSVKTPYNGEEGQVYVLAKEAKEPPSTGPATKKAPANGRE